MNKFIPFGKYNQATASGSGSTPPSALFQGFDTFTADARSTAVGGTPNEVGGEEMCNYSMCTSISSLAAALQINSELAASAIFGSIDAKVQYVHNLNLTESSVVVAVYANAIAGTTTYTNVGLLPGITIPKNVNDFYLGYGDSFVSEITLGAEYIATYVFYAETIEDQTSIVASLQAQGIGLAGSVSGSLDTAIRTVRNQQTARYEFQQTIFGITGVPLPTEANLAPFALAFAGLKPNPGVVIDIKTQGYENVPGIGDAFDPIMKTRTAFTGGLDGASIAHDYMSLVGLSNATKWILDVYATYGFTGDSGLPAKRQQILQDRRALGNMITTISQNATVLPPEPNLPSLAWGHPVLNFSTPRTGPVVWFTTGTPQTYFADVGYEDVLNQTKLASIMIGGWVAPSYDTFPAQESVLMVMVTYTKADGSQVSFSRGDNFAKYGSQWSQTTLFELQPNDQVVAIAGTEEEVNGFSTFSSLAIRTNAGAESGWPQAPAGDPQGDPVIAWTPATGEVFLGFSGATLPASNPFTGNVLLSLSPITTTFSSASWAKTPQNVRALNSTSHD
jgi:hypothetical protein